MTREVAKARAAEFVRLFEIHMKHDGPCQTNMVADLILAVERETLERVERVFTAARAVVSEQQPDGSGHPEDVEELKNALDGYDYHNARAVSPSEGR